MLQIVVYSMSKTRQTFLLEGEAEFLKRLKTHARVEIVEIGSGRGKGARSRSKIEELLLRVPEKSYLCVLDEGGEEISSAGLAELIGALSNRGFSTIAFAVGEADGWDPTVFKRANKRLSLSALTFTSGLARLILLEQLYRAVSILHNEPYHRG
jgi:23S rRNA (pseudouridine1915-N3)-methyltransferase